MPLIDGHLVFGPELASVQSTPGWGSVGVISQCIVVH